MNSISKQIIKSHQFFLKSLVGAVLIFSIAGIPFFLGYLSRYIHQIKEKNEWELPQWNNWLALLVESWELLLTTFLYGFLPGGIMYLITSSIDQYFGIFSNLLWIPVMTFSLLSPIFIVITYHQYLIRNTWESLFDIQQAFTTLRKNIENFIPVTLILWGALFIGFPVFGFTIAVSTIIYMPLMLHAIENGR